MNRLKFVSLLVVSFATCSKPCSAQSIWSLSYLPEDGFVTSLAINSKGEIFAVESGGHSWRSTDGGVQWSLLGIPNQVFSQWITVGDTDRLYAAGGGGVFYSIDNGDTWVAPFMNLPHCRAVVVGLNGLVIAGAYSRENGIFRSFDRGIHWEKVLDINGDVYPHISRQTNTIFAVGGVGSDTLVRSTDNGDSWHFVPYPSGFKVGLRFATDRSGNIYLTGGDKAGYSAIIKSTNDGASWFELDYKWESTVPLGIIVNILDHIYVAADGQAGLLLSKDGWKTVERYGAIGWDSNVSTTVTMFPDGRLLAGGRRRVYIGLKSVTGFGGDEPMPVPASADLSPSHPNPASAYSSIGFTVPSSEETELTLHNALGQTVKTVVHESLPPGTHNATVDVTSLPSGLYFYRLRTGVTVVSRTLVVMH